MAAGAAGPSALLGPCSSRADQLLGCRCVVDDRPFLHALSPQFQGEVKRLLALAPEPAAESGPASSAAAAVTAAASALQLLPELRKRERTEGLGYNNGPYRCRVCGRIKRGHQCPGHWSPDAPEHVAGGADTDSFRWGRAIRRRLREAEGGALRRKRLRKRVLADYAEHTRQHEAANGASSAAGSSQSRKALKKRFRKHLRKQRAAGRLVTDGKMVRRSRRDRTASS